MSDDEAKLRKMAFAVMLDTVNAWHREVGIDEIMKTKLVKAIADTVATRVFQRHIAQALAAEREAGRQEALEEAAKVAERIFRGTTYNAASENADIYRTQDQTAEMIADRIRALKSAPDSRTQKRGNDR